MKPTSLIPRPIPFLVSVLQVTKSWVGSGNEAKIPSELIQMPISPEMSDKVVDEQMSMEIMCATAHDLLLVTGT